MNVPWITEKEDVAVHSVSLLVNPCIKPLLAAHTRRDRMGLVIVSIQKIPLVFGSTRKMNQGVRQ